MPNSPVLWGPNGAINLQNQELLNNGNLLQFNGPQNLIGYNNFENGLTTGWSLGTTGSLTNAIPTGIPTFGSGAAGTLSIAAASTTPIDGTYSLSLVSSAATTAGNMFATDALVVQPGLQAKVLTFKFSYQAFANASNGNFSGTSSNSFGVACYDVTNSSWLSVAGNFAMTQGSGVGVATGTMQTNANTASIRFVVYCANATAGAITMYFDDFYLGPQTAPIGPVITDPVSYTPTGSWNANTTYTGLWNRDGKFLYGDVKLALTGAPTAASLTINLPAGLSIDTSAMSFPSTNQASLGNGEGAHSGVSYNFQVVYNNTTSVGVIYQSGTTGAQNTVNATTPITWANGDTIQLNFRVPIVGWSSNVQMSNDTDTRIVDFVGTQTSQAVTANVTNIAFTTVKDSHGAWNGTQFIIPVSGDYVVCGSIVSSAQASPVVYKNGTGITNWTTVAAGVAGGGAVLLPSCIAGDLISIRMGTSVTVSGGYLSIFHLSGPSVIAATESVNARYTFVGATAIPNNSNTTLTATYATYTKVKDSHNAFSAGVYTIPVNGMYRASLRTSIAPSTTSSGGIISLIQQGGSASTLSGTTAPFNTAVRTSSQVTDTFYCLAGDTLTFQVNQNNAANTIALDSNSFSNSISIERVGN